MERLLGINLAQIEFYANYNKKYGYKTPISDRIKFGCNFSPEFIKQELEKNTCQKCPQNDLSIDHLGYGYKDKCPRKGILKANEHIIA